MGVSKQELLDLSVMEMLDLIDYYQEVRDGEARTDP